MTPNCPVHQAQEAVSIYRRGNRVIGFCGLLCGRSHVTMSWVLNVSVTGHDKLSWHPRSQLYKPVINGYTAQLIHFKTLLYGNLWHSFWLAGPWRGTVDSVPRAVVHSFKCHNKKTVWAAVCMHAATCQFSLTWPQAYMLWCNVTYERGTFHRSCLTAK